MKLEREIVASLVKAQFDHLLSLNPDFPDKHQGHLLKVIVYASKVLEVNEELWGWVPGFRMPNAKVNLDPDVMVALFVYLLTQAGQDNQLDVDAVVDSILNADQPKTGFDKTINNLIQAATKKEVDFANYFRLLSLAGVSEEAFLISMIVHFALLKFRIGQGYMGVRPGNYIAEDVQRHWNDKEFTIQRATALFADPNAIDIIQNDLKNAYEQMLVDNVVPLKGL